MALRHQISAADTVHAPTKPKYRVVTKPAFGSNGEEIALIYTETDSRDVWRQEFWRNQIQGGFHSRVLKYDKSGEEVIGIQPPAIADFLIAYHNACEIDGTTAWLDFPIGDPQRVGDNRLAGLFVLEFFGGEVGVFLVHDDIHRALFRLRLSG